MMLSPNQAVFDHEFYGRHGIFGNILFIRTCRLVIIPSLTVGEDKKLGTHW